MASPVTNKKDGWKKLFFPCLLISCIFLAINCEPLIPRNGWSQRWGPLVPHKNFPGDCGLCHLPRGWEELRPDFSFDHEKSTGFRLEGAHAGAACLRCHNDRGPVSVYVARGCGGCHPDPHEATLGMDCTRCHEQTSWRPTGLIAEHARTRFPLFGVHAAAPCERCHAGAPVGLFRGAPVACDLCHRQDLARATSPDHLASGWTRDCERCHTPSSWSRANFAHNFFPLTGGHGGLECTRCHTSGSFGPIPSDCYSCHQSDYQGAPNHVSGGYDQNCLRCHSIVSWSGADFPHTFFPLTGGHGGLSCTRCHTGGTFGPIPSDCYSCHQSDYQGAPNHAALAFPRECQNCHSTITWTGATFNHAFPLRGPHNVNCDVCHNAGTTSTFTCLVCHDHSQTTMNDKHSEVSGYSFNSNACYTCHPRG